MIGESFFTRGFLNVLNAKSQDTHIFELTLGRMIKLTNNNKIRLNLKGGLGFARTKTTSTKLSSNNSLFGIGYKINK